MTHRRSPLSFTAHRFRSSRPFAGGGAMSGPKDRFDRAATSLKGFAEAKRSDFSKELQERLDDLQRRVENLGAKQDRLSADARRALDEQLAEARRKAEEARESTDRAWNDVRDGAVDAWHALSESVQSAVDRLAR